jgi:hypothetical protein
MGWETRQRGGSYYTRSRRVNGRVVREYIGGGERGEYAAAADAIARERREAERADHTRERRQRDTVEAQLMSWYAAVDAHLHQALTAAGYRQHKRGEWRRRRGSTAH